VLVVLALAHAARADDRKKVADETFEQGRKLMEQKRYAEACSAFEQSQRLDPQNGTLFNLADCEVHLGKLATAWAHYRELARTDANADRKELSTQLARDLEKRLPKLVVDVTPRPADVKLAVDGADSTSLVGVELPVDLGDHEVVASARGFSDAHQKIAIRDERKVTHVALALEPTPTVTTTTTTTLPHEDKPVSQPEERHPYRKITLAGGSAAVAVGLVFGALAYAKWHDTEHCTTCDRMAGVDRARVYADVSTGFVIVGLGAVGFGLAWRF
jgi:hypothetical protein